MGDVLKSDGASKLKKELALLLYYKTGESSNINTSIIEHVTMFRTLTLVPIECNDGNS